MNEPICAVCGETDIKKMTMFNYGVCLCHRCLEISAHSFIHDNAERRLKEIKEKAISVEGLPDRLCPDCLKKYGPEKAEEAAQIRMADLSIENNRLRTGLKDLKDEYESFRDRTSRVWWGVAVAGFAIGTLVTLMFLNPR